MLEVPVSGKTLEFPDSYRFIQFSAAAPEFTGMMADATTDSREGVALPDSVDGLPVFARSNMGNIFGDIDSYRTGVLTGRYHQSVTDGCRALLFLYMGIVLVPKVINGRKHRVRGGLTETA